ncbi:hypothetical protein BGZ73_004547 [Actinomortierella ambigua]|nr:hypothetical protein BGZ73_004547 [Actinomortierella ambigua]
MPLGSAQQYDNSPSSLLDVLGRMIQELHSTNSAKGKRDILAQYAPLAPILQWTYDPYRQLHVTSSSIIKYALAKSSSVAPEKHPASHGAQSLWSSGVTYNTLQQLLEALCLRSITGNKAKDSVMLFLDRFCRDPSMSSSSPTSTSLTAQDTLQQLLRSPRSLVFFKILDKHLKAGCSVGLISSVFPGLIPSFHVALGHSLLRLDDARKLFPSSASVPHQDEASGKATRGEGVDKGKKKRQKDAASKKETSSSAHAASPLTATTSSLSSPSPSPSNASSAWFGSRKLDGVRCLITVSLATGVAEAVTRSGRHFKTLSEIETAVAKMFGGDSLEERTKFFRIATGGGMDPNADAMMTATTTATTASDADKTDKKKQRRRPESSSSSPSSTLQALPESLILDGEICVLDASQMTRTPLSGNQEQEGHGGEEGPFDFDRGGIGQESFLATVRYIKASAPTTSLPADLQERRMEKKVNSKKVLSVQDDDDMDEDEDEEDPLKRLSASSSSGAISPNANFQPVYCIFDCLTEQEFRSRKGTRPFSQRIQGLWQAMSHQKNRGASSASASATHPTHNNIRILSQHRICDFQQLEQIVAQSLERGWEGVMLRKNVGYEGRRSRNLLKIKKFQDAEFVVEDVLTGQLRLPDPATGQYKERHALTSVVIRHKGSRVRVGSGFSVEDRIRYAQHPELLLGKIITVQYFEESVSLRSASGTNGPGGGANEDRGGSDGGDDDDTSGGVSLRFPTVKAIYESGERDL